MLVAYLMTVTELGWERCLAATRAVRSYASPNPGFQQQLRDYESTLLDEVGSPSHQPRAKGRAPQLELPSCALQITAAALPARYLLPAGFVFACMQN